LAGPQPEPRHIHKSVPQRLACRCPGFEAVHRDRAAEEAVRFGCTACSHAPQQVSVAAEPGGEGAQVVQQMWDVLSLCSAADEEGVLGACDEGHRPGRRGRRKGMWVLLQEDVDGRVGMGRWDWVGGWELA
jgi:hypothetical protein